MHWLIGARFGVLSKMTHANQQFPDRECVFVSAHEVAFKPKMESSVVTSFQNNLTSHIVRSRHRLRRSQMIGISGTGPI